MTAPGLNGAHGRYAHRNGASVKKPDLSKYRLETQLALAGRDAARFDGAVNPAIHRATTVIIPDTDDLYGTPKKTYALEGMAVQEALRDALVAIEGGAGATLAPSGLSACTLAAAHRGARRRRSADHGFRLRPHAPLRRPDVEALGHDAALF